VGSQPLAEKILDKILGEEKHRSNGRRMSQWVSITDALAVDQGTVASIMPAVVDCIITCTGEPLVWA